MPLPIRSLTVLQNWDCHACTDCCREYRVQVSPEEKARIEAMDWGDDPAMKGVKLLVRDGGWLSQTYRLNQLPDSGCVFLDPRGGCRIHAKFGSEAKPLACRVYPFVLVPFGNQWRFGLRFACPSVANDLGRPVATHLPAVRQYVEALEQDRKGLLARLPVPMLRRGQTAPWTDIDLFVRSFRGFIQDDRRPLEWRLRKCLAVIELCREARFDTVTGDRLKEFLSVVGDGVAPDVPAHPEAVSEPGWIARMLFRQQVALYSRKDTGKYRGIARRGRPALLWAAWKFAQGTGKVPRVHAYIPETTFEQIENATGFWPDACSQLLTRYYQIKIESGQFFGPNNFNCRFWDGLETLLLTYPAIRWLARAMHDRPREEALTLALRIVDDNFGFNPLLGARRQLFAVRLLARRGDLARLIAWYSR